MRIPKRYGHSKIDKCPFCDRAATTKNPQDVPVCEQHKKTSLENLKCACGDWLDISSGKYGAYFRCMNCGNISFAKGIEMNPNIKEIFPEKKSLVVEKKEFIKDSKPSARKEFVVRSDDPNYFN